MSVCFEQTQEEGLREGSTGQGAWARRTGGSSSERGSAFRALPPDFLGKDGWINA